MHRRRSAGLAFVAMSLTLVGFSGWAATAKTPADPVAAIAEAQRLRSTLNNEAPPSQYAAVGRQLGQAIDGVRDGKATIAQLTQMREITRKLHERTTEKLKAFEAAAGEDEVVLESLYRSVDWDDISFALAAFPYWGAWIDLEMYRTVEDATAKRQWIWEAKKGFRGTSVQVFRPSLVYGGWLGLGYIAVAEEDNDRALKIFENLEEALGGDKGHPLFEVVSLQLRILRAKTGNVAGPAPGGAIDAQESQLLLAEAQALLQHASQPKHNSKTRREAENSAGEAAERLRRIIDAGHVNEQLIGLIVEYQEKLVPHSIGPLTPLVKAESSFVYGFDLNAANNYERFFYAVAKYKDLNLDHIRFRYALSSHKIKANKVAADTAERLLQKKDLDPRIRKAATKLAYVARASRQGNPTASLREELRKAAERLLNTYPEDSDADGARVTVAQNTTDSNKANAMLNAVKSPGKLRGPLEQTRFFVVARDFSNAIRRTDTKPPTALATRGLAAYQQLPKKQRDISENLAIMFQMRALTDSDPQAVMAAIDEAEKAGSLTSAVGQGILWARLKCFERLGDRAALLGFFTQLANVGLKVWQLEQIYPPISADADAGFRIEAAQVLLPGATADVSMERRFKIMMIEAMLELERYKDAYDHAKLFRQAYPKAGDGFRLYALAAAKTDRPVEADRAWRTITDRTDPRRDTWWEGMLHRAQIRAESTRPATACEVLFELDSRREFMPDGFKPKLEALRGTLTCPQSQTG